MNDTFQSEISARWARRSGRLALAVIVGIGATLVLVLGVKIAQAAPPGPYQVLDINTSTLGPELVGWDWFSIQLDDGSELMVFQLRKEDGTTDPFSSGMYVDATVNTTRLGHQDFTVTVNDTWRSPHSGAAYPARWTVTVPSEDLILEAAPYLADQGLDASFIYWEGAVRIVGEHAGDAVSGNGYVELTGYAHSMQGQL